MSYYNGSAYTFTWEGRRLVGAVGDYDTMSFTYNDDGIRTSKTVNGVEHIYYLNGSQIVAEEWGERLLVYLYDASGSPIGMMFRKTSYAADQWDVYWYEKNLQGDIISVYNSSGEMEAYYTYTDAWGNHSNYVTTNVSEGARYNPFRYRGYYYDVDLGMYYLQSRYYDAKICRFINADSVIANVGGNVLGSNLYAYCFNNPVNLTDSSGNWPQWVSDVIGWIGNNVVARIQDFFEEVKACKTSTDDPGEVANADFVANYNGKLFIRVPGDIGFSIGIIILGHAHSHAEDVQHEYGHAVQLDEMGLVNYVKTVAAPSVVAHFLDLQGNLPYDYYSSPWENQADVYGGVDMFSAQNRQFKDPWTPSDGGFWDLIKLFK